MKKNKEKLKIFNATASPMPTVNTSKSLDTVGVAITLKAFIRGFTLVLQAMRVSQEEIDHESGKKPSSQRKRQSRKLKSYRSEGEDGDEEDDVEERDDEITLAFSPRMEGICTLHRRRTIRQKTGRALSKPTGLSGASSTSTTPRSGVDERENDAGEKGRREDAEAECHRLRHQLKEANRKIAAMKKAALSQKFSGEVEIIDSDDEAVPQKQSEVRVRAGVR